MARGTLADAEDAASIVLVKGARLLRATHQIRLNTLKAKQLGKKLILCVSTECILDRDLVDLQRMVPGTIEIRRSLDG
jgi:hypothetical protein